MKIHTSFRAIVLVFFLSSITAALALDRGYATFYNRKIKGHHTSDGGKYHPDSLTCAHLKFPLGTLLRVRNPKNDKEVVVKVTDRGPHSKRLIIDLSYRAAKELDIVRAGIAMVEVCQLDSINSQQLTVNSRQSTVNEMSY